MMSLKKILENGQQPHEPGQHYSRDLAHAPPRNFVLLQRKAGDERDEKPANLF